MPKYRSKYEEAAQATVGLVDHLQTPNELSDAVLETLIIMAKQVTRGLVSSLRNWRGLSPNEKVTDRKSAPLTQISLTA